jgi:hypothetical protein
MNIILNRVSCAEADAEALAQECGASLEKRGFQVNLVRVVWKKGLAIIAIHTRGRRPRFVISETMARQVQGAKTPSLFESIAA